MRSQAIVIYGHNPLHKGTVADFTDWHNGTYYASVGIIGTCGTYQHLSRYDNDDCDFRGTRPRRNSAMRSARSYALKYAEFLGVKAERWECGKQVNATFRYPESRADPQTNERWEKRRR